MRGAPVPVKSGARAHPPEQGCFYIHHQPRSIRLNNPHAVREEKKMLDFSALPGSLAQLAASPSLVLLVVLLLAAAVIDWRTYRIPNWLTMSGMAAGLLCNAWP